MASDEISPQSAADFSLPPAPARPVIAFPHTGDYRKDALIESLGYRWNAGAPVGTPVTVTFSFAAAAPAYVRRDDIVGFQPFSTYERDLTREILTRISSFTNLDFREVADSATSFGQIRFSKNQQEESAGFAFFPFSNFSSIDGDVFISVDSITSRTTREEDYSLLIHEIFHAIGLKHSGNYNAGEVLSSTARGNFLGREEDSTAYTTMSYRGVAQGQQSLGGIYDILTLQYLYGQRLSQTGDNVYRLSDFQGTYLDTLIDGGGVDRLDLSALTIGGRVDLREGSFSSIGLVAPRVAAVSNYAIAFGTMIENVTGSQFDDFLTGNGLGNDLTGLAGNDVLDGLGGIDLVSYAGDPAGVEVNLALGSARDGFGGTDRLSNIELITGSPFQDILRGDGGRNMLKGLAGNDILDGGANPALGMRPQFIGDTADYISTGAISVAADLLLGRAEDGLGGVDTLIGIEDLIGSDGNDTLLGDNGKNGFRGFAGNDLIDGRGNDPSQGDFVSYFLDPQAVSVDLRAGSARDGFGGTDTLRNIENVNGSIFADTLTGDDNGNILQGLNGNDTISGGGGVDMAIYQGARNEYAVALMPAVQGAAGTAVRSIADRINSRDDSDILDSIERLLFSDGVLAFDNTPAGAAGKGYLLYRAAFDRLPDVEGLGYWIRELDIGKDFVNVMAESFVASSEFAAKNGSDLNNESFVNQLYLNVLDRAPDTEGGAYWLGQLNGGTTRATMLASFAVSDENFNAVRPVIADGIFFV